LKYSLPEVTQSGMLEEKPNCRKILLQSQLDDSGDCKCSGLFYRHDYDHH
jgi:hypothetical protein